MSEQVETLKATVAKLEKKIEDLESRLQGKLSSDSSDGMRMILIGPPGAGESADGVARPRCADSGERMADHHLLYRQGNTGPKDQGEVWLLPFGNRRHAARSGCREDRARQAGQEDHGRGQAGLGRNHDWHDQERVGHQQGVPAWVRRAIFAGQWLQRVHL